MLVDDNEELGSGSELEAVEQQQVQQQQEPQQQPSFEVPEKYKGKTAEDIIRMHQEAEKLIGKQAQEVGEVRKLADELLKQSLASKTQHVEQQEPEIDFFEDPKKAIQKELSAHPDVIAAREAALTFKKMQIQQKLNSDHPDFTQVVQDPEFVNWVKSSPVRMGLYAKADAEYDYDSANELLSTFKQIKSVKAKETKAAGEVARQSALKSAAVDVGGTGESSKKVYRRADLIRLRMTDPARYEALSDDIMRAYQEGRVK
jgi:hypothetical protein